MKNVFWDVICAAVACIILSLGLWPFHSPENDVSWLGDRTGLRFGKSSTAISSRAFEMAGAHSESSVSVEVWLQPRRIWDGGAFLAFYTPGNPHQLSLRQFDGGLEVRSEIRNDPDAPKAGIIYLKNTFVKSRPVFITITSGVNGTSVYVDGVLARGAPDRRLSAKDLAGRLVVGDSPGQTDSWSGELLGLAIYRNELTPTQVLRHYQTWTKGGRPDIYDEERNVALYLFGERTGRIVHDGAGLHVNLYIPDKYVVLDQILLEPFWKEFNMSLSYWEAALKNVVGFVPFGFCFYACLSGHKVKSAAIATVILGTLTSVTIEVLQGFLPTRDSGMTDIFTNTFGTWVGMMAYRRVSLELAARFPWLPFRESGAK